MKSLYGIGGRMPYYLAIIAIILIIAYFAEKTN